MLQVTISDANAFVIAQAKAMPDHGALSPRHEAYTAAWARRWRAELRDSGPNGAASASLLCLTGRLCDVLESYT